MKNVGKVILYKFKNITKILVTILKQISLYKTNIKLLLKSENFLVFFFDFIQFFLNIKPNSIFRYKKISFILN